MEGGGGGGSGGGVVVWLLVLFWFGLWGVFLFLFVCRWGVGLGVLGTGAGMLQAPPTFGGVVWVVGGGCCVALGELPPTVNPARPNTYLGGVRIVTSRFGVGVGGGWAAGGPHVLLSSCWTGGLARVRRGMWNVAHSRRLGPLDPLRGALEDLGAVLVPRRSPAPKKKNTKKQKKNKRKKPEHEAAVQP